MYRSALRAMITVLIQTEHVLRQWQQSAGLLQNSLTFQADNRMRQS